MAWIDDRLWCSPKWLSLSDKAKVVWVNSVAYSSGMGLRGRLTVEQQKLMGATTKTRSELVERGWWDLNGDGQTIVIHDWDEHNAVRDERRRKDRERKREARAQGRLA